MAWWTSKKPKPESEKPAPRDDFKIVPEDEELTEPRKRGWEDIKILGEQ